MLSILIVLALTIHGAAPIEGRVVDARTGTPVAGAEVTVLGQRGSVRTDRAGNFSWMTPPLLPADIVVVLADGRAARPIRLTSFHSSGILTLAIEKGVSESVTVVGAAPTIGASPAASTTLLTAMDIALRQPPTLSQALDAVPGVSEIAEGQAGVPAIRGLARGRTLILVDGNRATTERRAGANASFLDPGNVRSIEVARGPGSVAYGSDAFGGVIAARTYGPNHDAPVRVRFAGTAGYGVPLYRGDLEVTKGYGSGGILVGARSRAFDDYDAPAGTVTNSAWRDAGVRVRWEQRAGGGLWSVDWRSDVGRSLGRPRSDSDVILTSSPFDDSHRLTATYERPSFFGFRNIRFDALAGAWRQRTDQDRLPTPARPRSVDRADLSSRDMQLRLTGDRLVGPARLHAGVDVQGRYGLHALDTTLSYTPGGDLASETTSVSIESARRTAVGLFAETSGQVVRGIRLSGGLRVDAIRNTNAAGFFGDRSVSNAAVSGLVAVTAAPLDRLTLTAQAARGFRDPILSDRFYRGPVGRGFIEGNPDLQPETSLQFDLAARYVAGPMRLVAAGYHYRITDLVERYTATATRFLFRNRGRADLRGVELEASATVPHGFALSVSAHASRGRDAVDGTPLDDVAPGAGSVTLRHGATRVSSYVRVKAVRAHAAAGPTEVPTPGHTLVEAGTIWRLAPHLEVRGSAHNLLDRAYPSSAGPRWVWAPGRQASVTMVLVF